MVWPQTDALVTSPTCVTVTAPPQLSEVVTLLGFGAGTEDTVTFAGHVMLGAVVSLTVMVCDALLELPQASVAVHVRVITLLQLDPGLLWVWP